MSTTYVSIFVPIILVNIFAWLTPGPNMIAVINATISHGRGHGFITGLGLAASACIWAIFAVAGVNTIFNVIPELWWLIRILGSSYLIWLGVKLILSWIVAAQTKVRFEKSDGVSTTRSFVNGFLIGVTNPKAALFFGSILTAFVPPEGSMLLDFAIVALCTLLGVLLHGITAFFFSQRIFTEIFQRLNQSIKLVIGTIFIFFGVSATLDTFSSMFINEPGQ